MGDGMYITHTEVGSVGELGEGFYTVMWPFDWQAPVDFEGSVTFYAAGNISNGDGTSSGDLIFSDSFSIEVIDGSGPSDISGCTNPEALNYDPEATVDDGSCEFNISNSTQITSCGGTLFDSGGPTGDYLNNENYTITIYPEVDGEFVSLYFASFQLETCCDYLTIYDGESINAPILVPVSNGTS